MARYWDSNEGATLDDLIDKHVGLALKEYITGEESSIMLSLLRTPEPVVIFDSGEAGFERRAPLFDLLLEELECRRPGGPAKDADLFFDAEGDANTLLLQALIGAFLDWRLKQCPK